MDLPQTCRDASFYAGNRAGRRRTRIRGHAGRHPGRVQRGRSRPSRLVVEERQLDLRYRGQAHELTVAVPAAALPDVLEVFDSAFERQFGRRDSGRGVEMVNLRVIGRIPMEAPAWTAPGGGTGRPAGARLLLGFDAPCDVWARADILPIRALPGLRSSRRCRPPRGCRRVGPCRSAPSGRWS